MSSIEESSSLHHHLKLEVEDVDGNTIFLEGNIPLIVDLNEYKIPSIDLEANLDWLFEWLSFTNLNLIESNDSSGTNQCAKEMWSLANYLVPLMDRSSERFQLFIKYLTFLNLSGDHEEMEKVRKGTTKLAPLMGDLIYDLMKNKYEDEEMLPDIPKSTFPLFKALISARDQSKKLLVDFLDNSTPMVKAMKTSILANPLLTNDSIKKYPNTFSIVKRKASGSLVIMELATLLHGYTLPAAIREDLLYQRIMDLASDILAILKDLSDLRKRNHIKNEYMNIFYIIKYSENIPFPEAFDKVLQQLETLIEEFRVLSETIKFLNKKNLRLHKYVNTIKMVIQGFILWDGN